MITPGPPVIRPEWNKKPLDTSQISYLLKLIANPRQNQITGEAVAFDWMKHRIQPLQTRVTFGFEYQGVSDPLRTQTKRSQRRRSMSGATTIREGGTCTSPTRYIFSIKSSERGMKSSRYAYSSTWSCCRCNISDNFPFYFQDDVNVYRSSPPLPGISPLFSSS